MPLSEFSLKVTPTDAQIIVNALGKLPLEVAHGTYQRVVAQLSQQQAAAANPPAVEEVKDGKL